MIRDVLRKTGMVREFIIILPRAAWGLVDAPPSGGPYIQQHPQSPNH